MKTCDVILLVFLLSRVAWFYQIVLKAMSPSNNKDRLSCNVCFELNASVFWTAHDKIYNKNVYIGIYVYYNENNLVNVLVKI
jgi:hypothetical protein